MKRPSLSVEFIQTREPTLFRGLCEALKDTYKLSTEDSKLSVSAWTEGLEKKVRAVKHTRQESRGC